MMHTTFLKRSSHGLKWTNGNASRNALRCASKRMPLLACSLVYVESFTSRYYLSVGNSRSPHCMIWQSILQLGTVTALNACTWAILIPLGAALIAQCSAILRALLPMNKEAN